MSQSNVIRLAGTPALSWDDLRLLVDSVVDYAIFGLDPDGRVTTWNSGAERMTGYTADEIVGRDFALFFDPADVAAGKPQRELTQAREQGRFEDEGFRRRKDGTRFWVNATLTSVKDAAGNLIGFAKVTRDLTERREREEAERKLVAERAAREAAEAWQQRIREREAQSHDLSQRLAIVLEGVADGITVQDKNGRLLFANSAAARICGFASGEELTSTPAAQVIARFEIFDESGQPFRHDELPGRRVLAGEPATSALLNVRHRGSGAEWWSMVRASPVLDAEGRPEASINIWHDVTAQQRQKRQEQHLADATAALGTSLDADQMLATLARALVPDLADWCTIYVRDGETLRSTGVAHVDPSKVAMARDYQRKYPPDPDRASGVWHVIRTGKSELHEEITDELLVQSVSDPERLEILRSIGMKAVLTVPMAVRGRTLGALAIISAESNRRFDASDVALVEELGRRAGVALENAQLYAAAHAAAKAAEDASRAKDEFLATVSHELRTPLSAILGWSTLLKQRVTDPALTKPIDVIHRNAQAQVTIIEDLLDVSRVVTGKLRLETALIDLVAVARDAIEVVRPSAAAKRITIELRSDAPACHMVADADRLQQVAWNLLSNAVKFTEPEGRVNVSIERLGEHAVLAVSDTGKGIAPDLLPFVFDRFMQVDSTLTRRVGGLGLGLSLVRHIVELHGGQVSAASQGLSRGSRFTVSLPMRSAAASSARTARALRSQEEHAAPAGALSDVRVLVVDDEPDALELAATVLATAGADVLTASSAAEAFATLQRERPEIVVSDIGMPDEDGYSLMQRVRALPPDAGGSVLSIALTAFTRDEDRARALEAGYTTYLSKPVSPSLLASTVAMLASATSASPRRR